MTVTVWPGGSSVSVTRLVQVRTPLAIMSGGGLAAMKVSSAGLNESRKVKIGTSSWLLVLVIVTPKVITSVGETTPSVGANNVSLMRKIGGEST